MKQDVSFFMAPVPRLLDQYQQAVASTFRPDNAKAIETLTEVRDRVDGALKLLRQALPDEERRKKIVNLARKRHYHAGELEIDFDAEVSEGEDNGCFVQAWVWCDFEGTEFDKRTAAVG